MRIVSAVSLLFIGATALAAPRIATPRIATPTTLVLPDGPDGGKGIGFDDMGFSPTLHRVLAPAGRTGKLALIDPKTLTIETIGGFSADADRFAGGHGEGTTSADVGGGFLFASDRSRTDVEIVDLKTLTIAGRTKLAAGPDYVRWVGAANEVWVTEPSKQQIEFFALDKGRLVRKGTIAVAGGPESLIVDATRGRAYTHTWQDETVAIEIAKHQEAARWKNGCKGSRGIALDEKRGQLFVGCDEGKATVLDVVHGGKQLGSAKTGRGVDIVAYDPTLSHLYVPGGDDATLTILGVAAAGTLSVLGSVAVAADAHCVAVDDAGHAYVCDPKHGAVLVVTDPFAASK
jgi:DNA-binding beta-propeller fold protein YncE